MAERVAITGDPESVPRIGLVHGRCYRLRPWGEVDATELDRLRSLAARLLGYDASIGAKPPSAENHVSQVKT